MAEINNKLAVCKSITEKAQESAAYIKRKTDLRPLIAIVLGSGLGGFAQELSDAVEIPYEQIPHFMKPTAPGHKGRLIIGKVAGTEILCMQGRFHLYEGYSMQEATYHIRVMKELGIEKILLTNASGGVDRSFRPGDLMMITDHINFTGNNPLIGPNLNEYGVRFPDMTYAYHPELQHKIRLAAERVDVAIKEGVYAGVLGPSFETPAEIRMFQTMGAGAVGMSTVPEVIVANHCGIMAAGISCITNCAAGIFDQPLTEEEVFEIADLTAPRFVRLLTEIVKTFADT